MEKQLELPGSEAPRRKRGRPKGSKNKPKFQAPLVHGKARAGFSCDGCSEEWVLPVAATVCPDPDCHGNLSRIWSGSAPGIKSAGTTLVDRVVGEEVAYAKKQLEYKPEFKTQGVQGNTSQAFKNAMGMIPPDGRAAAQGNWANRGGILGNLGGPKPFWAR